VTRAPTRTLAFCAPLIAALGVGSALGPARAMDPLLQDPTCSVFDGRPCMPTVCGLFDGPRCVPQIMAPYSQDLRLTVESRTAESGHAPSTEKPLDTLRELFAALRACWEPPAREEARHGMQMSVRFSFKRSGEIIGTPRVTYALKDSEPETREVYWRAITAALERCTPMPLSKGLGGAIAGRPIAIRFIDDRTD
jgi:hypothetical protein